MVEHRAGAFAYTFYSTCQPATFATYGQSIIITREGGREGGRERGREGGREGGREEGRKKGREGGRERGWEGEKRSQSLINCTQIWQEVYNICKG